MRLSDFIMLGKEEKKLAVLHDGVLVGKRQVHDHIIFLFQFGHFYVETFCNTGNREVEEFRVFDGTKPLTPYLEAIRIDDLVN